MKIKLSLLFLFSILVIHAQQSPQPQQQSLDSIQKLDEVILRSNVIFGNKLAVRNRTGSSYFIAPTELKKLGYVDINRVLRTVPGVTIVEEEGFGLRPNISLRGTSPERSAKISLMEDGILIAPAPYSASAAYYYPSVARMQAVEILKGSSQVQYGPFTNGGAINMVSTEIPQTFTGRLKASYGSFNSSQIYTTLGDSKSNFGYNIEYLNFNSDGFKNLPDGDNTGFDKNDLVTKFRINTDQSASVQQSLQLKFQYSNEVSNETYLGLTDRDFADSPYDRYAASQKDKMTNDHIQFLLTHELDLSDNFRITSNGYYNGFSRNWYKLNDITVGDSRIGLSDILENPDDYPTHFDVITGLQDNLDGGLAVKANNRSYISKGIQTRLNYRFFNNEFIHDLELGLRYHYDEEDRFQWVDLYDIENNIMALSTRGIPGTDANRISSARAFAGFFMYKLKYKNFTLTPGFRYENITLEREDYGTDDINRVGINLTSRENKIGIMIPGIGANYKFNNDLSVFGGIHKGFSPPGNAPGEKAEESINYELGTRFNFKGLSGEIIVFYNDYSNLLGSDLAATGGTGSLDQFNAGEVNVSGLELLLNYNPLSHNSKFDLPITLGYTLTDTEFLSSFDSDDGIWGTVTTGDEIPYIARHQANASVSLEHQRMTISLNGRYNGAFRTVAGRGSIPVDEKVPSSVILDLSGRYKLSKSSSLTANVINLLDNSYMVSRVPAGVRPGHPFGVYFGMEFNL